VRILFDVNTPAPLRHYLRGNEVTRAAELGWQLLKNGALLEAAEREGFEVLVTCDQNLRHQQNFKGRKLAVVVLSTNKWPLVRAAAARIATAVDFIQRGQVVKVEIATL
jgi:hypothetical protein